jgi:hypothetical protein
VGRVLRLIEDVGYLSNKRMALEVGVGLAHLSGRTLSMPVDRPVGWGPRPAVGEDVAGPPSSLRDLFAVPVPVMGEAETTAAVAGRPVVPVDWPDLHTVVVVDPPGLAADADPDSVADLEAFATGRPAVGFDPRWDEAAVLDVPVRALGFYSYLFYLRPERRRELFALMERIHPRQPYVDLAEHLAAGLGRFNVAHIRRTDHLVGVPAYRAVSPWLLRDNLASVFPAEERLVVCTEADPDSDVFVPLRSHFADVVFLSQAVLGSSTWRERFLGLPRHDDPALAMVSQEVAVRAQRFAGTFASTFTGNIHRGRHLRDPAEPFLFTADFLGGGTRFEAGRYLPVHPGPYTWNRLGYPVGPDALAWMREWPEVAQRSG